MNHDWPKYTFERKQKGRPGQPGYVQPAGGASSDDEGGNFGAATGAGSSSPQHQPTELEEKLRQELDELKQKTADQLLWAAAKNKDLEDAIAASDLRVADLENRFTESTTDNRRLQDELTRAIHEANSAEVQKMRRERDDLQRALDDERLNRITRITEEERTLIRKNLADEKERLVGDLDLLRAQVESLVTDKSRLESELKNATQTNITVNEKMLVEERKKFLSELNDEKNKFERERSQLDEQIHTLRRDNHLLDDCKHRLQHENSVLTEHNKRLQAATPPAQREHIKHLEEEKLHLTNQIHQLEKQLKSAKQGSPAKANPTETKEYKELQTQNELLQKHNQTLEQKIETMSEELKNYERGTPSPDATVQRVQIELSGAQEELRQVTEQLKEAQSSSSKLVEENKRLGEDKTTLLSQLAEATRTIENMKKSYEELLATTHNLGAARPVNNDSNAVNTPTEDDITDKIIVQVRGSNYRADLLRKVFNNHKLAEGMLKKVRNLKTQDPYLKFKRSPQPSDYVGTIDGMSEDLAHLRDVGNTIISLYFTTEEKLTVGLPSEAQGKAPAKPLPLDLVTKTTTITHGGQGDHSPGKVGRSPSSSMSGSTSPIPAATTVRAPSPKRSPSRSPSTSAASPTQASPTTAPRPVRSTSPAPLPPQKKEVSITRTANYSSGSPQAAALAAVAGGGSPLSLGNRSPSPTPVGVRGSPSPTRLHAGSPILPSMMAPIVPRSISPIRFGGTVIAPMSRVPTPPLM